MKIVLGYLPYKSKQGTALVSQNRQFMWSKAGTVIYPVVMASCATMLKSLGHQVLWMDGIAEKLNWEEFQFRFMSFNPDYCLFEVKTPVIEQTWEFVNELKHTNPMCKIVLCGDHVTALPKETYASSSTDHILLGGNYDSEFVKLLKQPTQKIKMIDRSLTKYERYSYANGNFSKTPGAYTMFSRDCWHRTGGGCTFCSWTNLYRGYSVQTPEEAMVEIENLAKLGIKEIFDDSGTFPVGAWLQDFIPRLKKFNKGLKHEITMGCNMRSGVLSRDDWRSLKEAGFRLVLLGFESANDSTLERLNKLYTVGDVVESCKLASGAGLDVHTTSMVGFPWETKQDAFRTIGIAKSLFERGYTKTLQATVCIPYPGTKLFKDCEENDWLLTKEWSKYDQSQAVMRTDGYDPVPLAKSLYKSCLTPKFIIRSLLTENPTTILRYGKALWNHIR